MRVKKGDEGLLPQHLPGDVISRRHLLESIYEDLGLVFPEEGLRG